MKAAIFPDIWPGDKELPTIKSIPENYSVFASTEDVEVAGYSINGEQTYGVQFHPEVYHSTDGKQLLKNFLVDIAGITPAVLIFNGR